MELSPEFEQVVAKVSPLFYIALILSFLFNGRRIRESYRCHRVSAWLIQYAITSIMTAVLAVATTFLIPLVFPSDVSYEIKLGITCYICVFGVKALNGFARKKFGFSIVEVVGTDDTTQVGEKGNEHAENIYDGDACSVDMCKKCKYADTCEKKNSGS